MSETNIDFEQQWYFGGIAATGATIITYPIEVLKVPMQTRRTQSPILQMAHQIFYVHGFSGLYSGLRSQIFRQGIHSFLRFGLYDLGKVYIDSASLNHKIFIAAFAGGVAGFVTSPAVKINVRTNNDLLLPEHKRRNYKNFFHGAQQIYMTEGIAGLYAGGLASTIRGSLFAVGQIAIYDEVLTNKIIRAGKDHNSMITHFEASLISGIIGSIITEPFNVIRSRLMEGPPKGFRGLVEIIVHTAKYSHYRFYKGFTIAFMQMVPNTILTFMFMEQLRLHYGKRFVVGTYEKPSSLRDLDK